LLTAAVPEEFFRFAWQTRVGALRRNRAAGWFIASVAWAILHAPRFWDEGHSAIGTLMGVVDIVPLGLLWGYLMHRTRSLLPSTLLHATNIWGLQNLA
jgi:membrane protease YdiL (CAAX protease family)